jgi:biopolymer transport protein ExbD
MAKRSSGTLALLIGEECKLDMTPMIDVTFLLIIFFMCTLKFKTLEGKLSAFLPKDVGVNTTPAEPKEKIEIRMDVKNPGNKMRPGAGGVAYTAEDETKKLRFIFDDSRTITYSIGAKKTTDIEEVRKTLQAFFRQDPTRPATIDPRAGIITKDVVALLDVALEIGFTDITFVGSYEK